MRQIFPADFVEGRLRFELADGHEIANELGIVAGIDFVDEFVVPRQAFNAHLLHRIGDAQRDVTASLTAFRHHSVPGSHKYTQ